MSTASAIRHSSRILDTHSLQTQVKQHLNHHFPDLDSLAGTNEAGPSHSGHALNGVGGGGGGHTMSREGSRRAGKKKRGLDEEIEYWEEKERAAERELEETTQILPGLLQDAQERLSKLLNSAQDLSIERYALADKLANLLSELDSSTSSDDDVGEHIDSSEVVQGRGEKSKTILEQMETMQDELSRLEVGLVWVSVLEQVLFLSEQTLSPASHHPSPLAALPHYKALHKRVDSTVAALPQGMGLTGLIVEVRDRTWKGLKDIMSQRLLKAAEPLKWPLRVDYPSVPAAERRDFERAYQDLLFLQAEGENLGIGSDKKPEWFIGDGLYPLQALVQPIGLRFKYHFQGSRNTNRVDKPEWAFSNILDQIYEHQQFIEEYLQPLTAKAGYDTVDVKSDFIALLFPILLSMLRSRIPHLLDHPALLAHTIYQTVVFDDSVRESGFDIDAISIHEGVESAPEWEGLAGVLLRQEGWYQQWLAGEKKFAESQLQEIISSAEAWTISEEVHEDEGVEQMKPTVSARQVKALIEQITDRYSPLPSLSHRIPFANSIQLPLLLSYLSRISGSLDAFETLSSAFVRAVPGALSGNTRSGVHIDQAKLTGGKAGLERLIKAGLSAGWVLDAMRGWADELFFVEMSSDVARAAQLRWSIKDETLLPAALRSGEDAVGVSVFDVMIERYEAIEGRVQDMVVRHISVEVENDLKQHLTRRWDRTDTAEREPDPSLLHSLTTLSSHLTTLSSLLPPLAISRVYRRIISHLVNHISQRAVYAGWSKFSELGGKDFAEEVKDWLGTCTSALTLLTPATVEVPWKGMRDIARILALPQDVDGQGEGDDIPTFSQAMAAAWAGEESLVSFTKRMGVDVGREELQGVLRRRVECWR